MSSVGKISHPKLLIPLVGTNVTDMLHRYVEVMLKQQQKNDLWIMGEKKEESK